LKEGLKSKREKMKSLLKNIDKRPPLKVNMPGGVRI
jgi:hypothetical protein